MITLSHLSLQHGSRVLFDDVNLSLSKWQRYGVVGANGAGKSSLLKLISREEESTLGDVNISKSSRIGWLKQDQHEHDDERIVDVVLQGDPDLWRALEYRERLLNAEEWTEAMGYKIAEVEEEIGRLGGYSAEMFAEKLLIGLGIEERYHQQPLKTLSGGYKLRVLLARTLFQKPDVMLLDEPTNYLDIVTIAWLEKFLIREFEGVLVFVSHDHDFLNNVSTHILDIDYGEIRCYTGNYEKYLTEKGAVQEQKLKMQKSAEDRVAKMQSFIDRFKYKPTKARQCQSREKMIEKVEWPDIKSSSRQHPNFKFKSKRPSGRKVFECKGICKSYDGNKILSDINLEILRGEKVAIIGANGVGKSTLIKVALGDTQADLGSYQWGYETHIGYIPQDPHELLKGDTTVNDWLYSEVAGAKEVEVRRVLGACLFSDDDVNKPINILSGGEMIRLLLAKMILSQVNVLVFDEPTNHLDLEARESLSKALKSFDGTAIFVSHDRSFVHSCAERTLFITHEEVLDFVGEFDEAFLELS